MFRKLLFGSLALAALAGASLLPASVTRAETVGETEVQNVFVVEYATFANGVLLTRYQHPYPDILACTISATMQALQAGLPVRPDCLPGIIDEMGDLRLVDARASPGFEPETPGHEPEIWACPMPEEMAKQITPHPRL